MKRDAVIAEMKRQVESGLVQGVVAIANTNHEYYTYGTQDIAGNEPMTERSRFDIASVGKIFTTGCCGLLYCAGELDIDAPFTEYLPEHALGKNCRITVRDLANHAGGFDNSKPYHDTDPDAFFRKLMQQMPVRPRRTMYEYSCYNFITLGKIVERISGMDLDKLSRKLLWGPLGMTNTTWNPPGPGPDEVQHHDPVRFCGFHNDRVCADYGMPLGSGSAFSTAGDLLLYLDDIVNRKTFPEKYYELISTPDFRDGNTQRSFGWDMSPASKPAELSDRTISHTGWTGQTVFADAGTGVCGVVMTSRIGDYQTHQPAVDGRIKIFSAILTAE